MMSREVPSFPFKFRRNFVPRDVIVLRDVTVSRDIRMSHDVVKSRDVTMSRDVKVSIQRRPLAGPRPAKFKRGNVIKCRRSFSGHAK